MNKIIKLCKINKTLGSGDDTPISVDFVFEINGSIQVLNFTIQGGVTDCVSDRCDSFVVALLYHALTLGYDFESSYPISTALYYNLTHHYLPQIYESNKGTVHRIKINAPLTDVSFDGGWNATGISCGIDSFTTLKEYTVDCEIPEYRLTHLLYFKVGAHHGLQFPTPPEVEDRVFKEELEVARKFCDKYNWPLVIIESNINHLSNTLFGHTEFECVCYYRCFAAALMLQNVIKRYYIATGYTGFNDLDMDINHSAAHRSWWEEPLFSTSSMQIIPANKAMSRIEKTIYLSDFAPTYDSLMVCWRSHQNCGFCNKCIRTLVTLDVLGILDKYESSFDLPNYYKWRGRFFQRVVGLRKTDAFFGEIYNLMKERNIHTPNKILSHWSAKFQLNRRRLPAWLSDFLNKVIPN